jgi:hypothetical protein
MKVRILFASLALALSGCNDTSPTEPLARRMPREPRLLTCPNSTPLTSTFVADPLLGGSLTLAGTTVTIPSGAVTLPTVFVVTIPASRYMEIEVHALGLTEFIFGQPATISIDYSRCTRPAADRNTLQAFYIDSDTKALLENMNGTDDKAARKVTFNTGHLSGYALAY